MYYNVHFSIDFYYRPIIHYRDLDAPKEPEENFI